MKKNLVIINNEKCIKKNESYFCENIEISSINDLLSKNYNVKYILRESVVNPIYKINNRNVITGPNIFVFIKNVIVSAIKDKSIYLIISVTPYTFISFLFLLFLRKKMFLYLRSDGEKEISEIFGKKTSAIYKLTENLMTKFCNLLVVNNLISNKKKYHLVNPSQIDEDWFKSRKKTERADIKLLYVGRYKIEKGFFSLIDIFKKIKLQGEKKVLLTMIGQGNRPHDDDININFINPISTKKDLITQYDKHDIFILPSFTEGHPQVLIESLVRERPVIVFEEIEHVAKNYEGVFVIKRDPKVLSDMIVFIDKNYDEILEKMKKNKYPTKEDFLKQLNTILN